MVFLLKTYKMGCVTSKKAISVALPLLKPSSNMEVKIEKAPSNIYIITDSIT
jgi:hypothetical protein